MAISRGPLAKARRQRAASHISATESGPPETASTIAGAAFQDANRRFASRAEIVEWLSPGMTLSVEVRSEGDPFTNPLALNPLLLTVHRRLDAGRCTRIFPRHLAKG